MSEGIITALKAAAYEQKEGRPTVVVRLRTEWWHDNNGIYQKKSLTVLRRKSQGHNYLLEDASCAGAMETMQSIVNLDDCKDGVYLVDTCNISRDWESGIVDGWDLKLVPWTEEK